MAQISSGSQLISLLTNGAIPDLDTLVSKRTGGSNGNPQTKWQHKEFRVASAAPSSNTIAGQWTSLWQMEGQPSHGAAPTSWTNPTNATAGSLMQANASGGRNLYLTSLAGVLTASAGILMVYDRLGHMAGMSGTTTTAQNVNGGSAGGLSRYTTGERNFLALEIYSQLGVTSGTATAVYTNQAGTASQVTQSVVIGNTGRREEQRMIMMSLALGDYGVRDCTSVTITSTATAGNFGVTIGRPLFYLPVGTGSNFGTLTSFVDGPIPQVLANACIALAFLPTTAAGIVTDLQWEMVEA
jgi:hypothetical protein